MEPRWLQERRQKAAELEAKLPIPTQGEYWRRTNLTKIGIERFAPTPPAKNGSATGEASQLLPVKLLFAGELLFGERFSPPTLDTPCLKNGVVLLPLSQAVSEKEELVANYLGRAFPLDDSPPLAAGSPSPSPLVGEGRVRGVMSLPPSSSLLPSREEGVETQRQAAGSIHRSEEKFILQNEAHWQTGVFCYVPKNTVVESPLLMASAFSNGNQALFPRILIVLDKGAKATLLNYHTSTSNPDQTNFTNTLCEVYLEEGADLTWIDLQNLSSQTYEVATKHVEVGPNAHLKWVLNIFGSKLSKTNVETVLAGEGARAEVIGLMLGKERQHLELCSITHHRTPHTTADILIKSTATDRAKTIFQGMIKIDKSAQQTESYMANHNLVLSEKAHADSIPRLEIEADDVKASHGATIGQVDKEQLFYLRSKGLNEEKAQRLLVEGFYEDIFGRVPVEPIRELMRRGMAIGHPERSEGSS